MLRAMQCDQVQGFLLGRPMQAERAIAAVPEHVP
jgi:EAL domain-containing protein (putative c-di-GMP-specific phosphodiesterase class I)